ncbi:hypothetical protein ACWGJW_11365 [Streptomyces nigrescens]
MDVDGAHAAIQLPEGSWWDWDVVAWDGGELRLAAGHDLAYHHGLELVFGDPVFVSCPSGFQDPAFRAPVARRAPENHSSARREAAHRGRLRGRRWRAGAGLVLIAAERLDVVQETVLRYWREDAGPDQRFAPWARAAERRAEYMELPGQTK